MMVVNQMTETTKFGTTHVTVPAGSTMTRARDSAKARVKARVRTAVETLAVTGVTGRGLVTIVCSATARATKAATRTYRAIDSETSMVAAAVTTKEGASATGRVMDIMKATNGIPRSAYGCSKERETRATDCDSGCSKNRPQVGIRLLNGEGNVRDGRSDDSRNRL